MIEALLVGAGGVAGAVARHLLGEHVDERTVDALAVNVLGSLGLGLLLGLPVADRAMIAPGTGFCGAFTTFSTFAVETVRLAEDGDLRPATVNAVVTLLGALLAVALGVWLAGAVS